MSKASSAVVCALIQCLSWPAATGAQSPAASPLSLQEVVSLARERAPEVAVAQARVDEARARLIAASVTFRTNPEIDTTVGKRFGVSTDLSTDITQMLETGGQRSARIAAAQAAIAGAEGGVKRAKWQAAREAAVAFTQVLGTQERIRLAESAHTIAENFWSATRRRLEAGDVAALDVNLAAAAAAQTASELADARASMELPAGELRRLLRLPPDAPVPVQGELRAPEILDVEGLAARAQAQPALRILEAEVQEAQADMRLGRAARRPDVGVGTGYERDEGDQVVFGRLIVTLPVFERGQGTVAAGQARAARAQAELVATREAIVTEVHARARAFEQRRAALTRLAEVALPALVDNDTLAERSYEAGQINLVELLLIRREALTIRKAYVDHLTEALVARIEVEASAGVLR